MISHLASTVQAIFEVSRWNDDFNVKSAVQEFKCRLSCFSAAGGMFKEIGNYNADFHVFSAAWVCLKKSATGMSISVEMPTLVKSQQSKCRLQLKIFQRGVCNVFARIVCDE